MAEVTFEGIGKQFGTTVALESFDLTVQSGELVCLLGPSGCGKTTALRILAGFEHPDHGDVRVAGRSVLDVDARHRGFGMVFQSYSLFPNMTARRNIAFALAVRGVKGAAQRARVDDLLELTRLVDHADKYPHQLSGGQQQRVALARALATEPPVLLLDEPLSALDAAVREQLRDEIRRLQRRVGITTLLVTHDQHEAMAVADRIGVMSSGRLEQVGAPAEVYARPATAFVGSFLGTSNRVAVVQRPDGATTVTTPHTPGSTTVQVRPEHLRLVSPGEGGGVPATVTDVLFQGALTRVVCQLGDERVVVDVASAAATTLAVGTTVAVVLDGPAAAVCA